MNDRDTRTLEIVIDSACKEALNLSDENQSRLAQLMTVWISGYLEVTCRDVLLTYVEGRSGKTVARFVAQRLRRIRSPNINGILDLVRSFDKDLANELKKFVTRESIKESVNSVVELRNQIAHGTSVTTTIANAKNQFEDSKRLAGKLKELFDAGCMTAGLSPAP